MCLSPPENHAGIKQAEMYGCWDLPLRHAHMLTMLLKNSHTAVS